jgi:hypothetical protein
LVFPIYVGVFVSVLGLRTETSLLRTLLYESRTLCAWLVLVTVSILFKGKVK